jgi:hypothetical protein
LQDARPAPEPRTAATAPSRQTHGMPHRVPYAPSPAQPEVLVPPGQLAAALMLSDVVSDGRTDAARLSALTNEAPQPLEVKAIEIAPLEVPIADPGKPSGSGRD